MAYTQKQKQKALDKFNQLREAGKTTREAAKATGVAYLTILRWTKAQGKTPAGAGPMVPKGAARTDPSAKLSVTTPDGYLIEADDPKDVVRVLNGLR